MTGNAISAPAGSYAAPFAGHGEQAATTCHDRLYQYQIFIVSFNNDAH